VPLLSGNGKEVEIQRAEIGDLSAEGKRHDLEETMKKLLLVLASSVFLIPTACSQANDTVATAEFPGGSARTVAFDAVPGNPASSAAAALSDTVTFPASLFAGQSLDDIRSDAQKSGVENVVRNKDGSVTYKMSKAVRQQLVIDTRQKTIRALQNFRYSGYFPFVQNVLYSNDFSEITLVTDKSRYDTVREYDASCDSALLSQIGSAVTAYQTVSGAASVKTTLRYRDGKTNQMFKTALYPVDLSTGAQSSTTASSSASSVR
jgi:hypothetical protein